MKEKEWKKEWEKTDMATRLAEWEALLPHPSSSFQWREGQRLSGLASLLFPITPHPLLMPDEGWREAYGDIGRNIFFLPSSLGYSALPHLWALVLDQTVHPPSVKHLTLSALQWKEWKGRLHLAPYTIVNHLCSLSLQNPRMTKWHLFFTSSNTPKGTNTQKSKMHEHYRFKMSGWLTHLKHR